MSFKRILLPINGEDDISQTADLAFTLAKKHHAQVQGIFPQHNDWKDYWLDNYGMAVSEIEELELQAKQKAAEAAQEATDAFKAHSERHKGVDTDYLSTFEDFTASLIEHSYCADLAVLATVEKRDNRYWRLLSDRLLAQSTRPVLVAPSRPVSKDLGKRIVIAWKKSAEASRAIAAAMPMIEMAEKVVVASVGEDGGSESTGRLRDYLSLHCKQVDGVVLDPNGEKPGKLLVDFTAEEPGSILVMGAFSHRRWREEIFGGVTDYVLHNADVPVFMMH